MTQDANTNREVDIETARRLLKVLNSDDVAALEAMLSDQPGAASARDDAGVCLLAKACYMRKTDAVSVIARHLVKPDMIEATLLGRVERIEQITAGDPKAILRCSPDGFAPLHLACYFNQPAVAMWLLDHGADANAVSTNPPALCPIHSAAVIGADEIVRALIKHGADVNRKQAGRIHRTPRSRKSRQYDPDRSPANRRRRPVRQNRPRQKPRLDIAKEKSHNEAAKRLS